MANISPIQCGTSTSKWSATSTVIPPPPSIPSGMYSILYKSGSGTKKLAIYPDKSYLLKDVSDSDPNASFHYDASAQKVSSLLSGNIKLYLGTNTAGGVLNIVDIPSSNLILGSDGTFYDSDQQMNFAYVAFINSITLTGVNPDKNWVFVPLNIPTSSSVSDSVLFHASSSGQFIGPNSQIVAQATQLVAHTALVGGLCMFNNGNLSTFAGFFANPKSMWVMSDFSLSSSQPGITGPFVIGSDGLFWNKDMGVCINVNPDGSLRYIDPSSGQKWNIIPNPKVDLKPVGTGKYLLEFGGKCLNAKGQLDTCYMITWNFVSSSSGAYIIQLTSDTTKVLVNPNTTFWGSDSLIVKSSNDPDFGNVSNNLVITTDGNMYDQTYGYCVAGPASGFQFLAVADQHAKFKWWILLIVLIVLVIVGFVVWRTFFKKE